jgi:hypothetical protein
VQDLGLRIRTPRPSRPQFRVPAPMSNRVQSTKSPLARAFCRLIGGVWRFSLVVVINLDRTILALRISEVTRPDKCITPEIDPVLRGTSKLDTVNKFVNICL